ncbi:MAG: hypothetical protein PF694_04555 [Bacteroidetes bacterium]|jgi:hypothetical protein|nr:hypothetical protein [Bacteroidota bacterium]
MSIKAKIAAAATAHMMLWLLMFILLAGILFCAWGCYLLIAATALGPGVAALIVGGALIGLIVLVALIALASQKSNKRVAASRTTQPNKTPDNMIEHQLRPVLGDRATDWAKQNTGVAVAGALTAGVVLAASPRLRALLVGAVGPLASRKAMQAAQRFMD